MDQGLFTTKSFNQTISTNFIERNLDPRPRVIVTINGKKMTAIIDTGAEVSLLSASLAQKMEIKTSATKQKLKAANDSKIKVLSSCLTSVHLGGFKIAQKLLVVENGKFEVLLGANFLRNFSKVTFMLGDKKVKFDGKTVVLV